MGCTRALPAGSRSASVRSRMNVHHLELFYYVATHGGISAAARQIPYGVQQPAISGQMTRLESDLGVRLFERVPFRLTPAGDRLYAHVQPFFSGLPALAQALPELAQRDLRICGAEIVLRDHLPTVLKALRKAYPALRYSLRTTGYQSQVQAWLRSGEADVAFIPVHGRAPAGLGMTRLASLPLVLQVPRRSPFKTAEDVLRQRRVEEPLICLDEQSTVVQRFLRESKARGVVWTRVVEATSLDLVTRYVADGEGIGLNVALGRRSSVPGVRVLPLDGYTPLTMGALWSKPTAEMVPRLVEAVRAHARTQWPEAVHDGD